MRIKNEELRKQRSQDSGTRATHDSSGSSRNPLRDASRQKVLIGIGVLVILAGIPFCLGKYFEFSQPDPFDSGANVYSAHHILQGARIGVEEKGSASVGTLLVNILGVWLCGYNEIGPKAVQGVMQAAAMILMFVAMRKLFGTLAAAVGVIITSIYLSAPLIAKFGNDKMQYTVACTVLSVSCFVLGQLGGRWWYAVLAGLFAAWAPLFKQTGTSVIAAIGLFVVLQPLLKNRTLKQTGLDILLLLAGAVAGIAPLYIWILGWGVQTALPYSFVWHTFMTLLPVGVRAGQAKSSLDYVTEGRRLVSFSQQWPIVLRYYGVLILPIALAAGAIAARIVRMILKRTPTRTPQAKPYDRFVLLLAVWWILDMAFVWISPRSYEQYYLPINASGAMLGGYLVCIYSDYLKGAVFKTRPVLIGVVGLLAMIIMSWHILFGVKKSPYSGLSYGGKQRGYAQRYQEISHRRSGNLKGAWEYAAEYIRTHSQPTDKIYVWGWYPGIYVQAQRLSSASTAFCMIRIAPQSLEQVVAEMLTEFKQEMPKFIVDSRKRDVPMDRPPYELWPVVPKGFLGMDKAQFLPLDRDVIAAYDKAWSELLRERFGQDEARRYEILKVFREFVMNNYRIVQLFGEHVLFELKTAQASMQSG